MADSTRESEIILRDARRSLDVQREGGTHRRTGRKHSIGRGSADAKAEHFARMIKRILIASAVIFMGSMAVGLLIDGLGFGGIVITFFLLVAAVVVLTQFPRIKVPKRADLTRTQDARQLVSRTELWLEHQRPALPAPAVTLVDQIGLQLDALGLQLEHVDAAHPAAVETRKLVGEHLPDMVDAYRKIPEPLRREERAGGTPEAQLVDGLGRISDEIDRVTRQLADGALDDLAIRTRYLEYRYGDGDMSADQTPTENR